MPRRKFIIFQTYLKIIFFSRKKREVNKQRKKKKEKEKSFCSHEISISFQLPFTSWLSIFIIWLSQTRCERFFKCSLFESIDQNL